MKRGDRVRLRQSSSVPMEAVGCLGSILKEPSDINGPYYQVAMDMIPEDAWTSLNDETGDLARHTFTVGHRLPNDFPGDQRLLLYVARHEMEPAGQTV